MKVTPQFIILCREAFLEAGTNNLNLIKIFSQITGAHFPFTLPTFALVVNFDIDTAGSYKLHTTVLNPEKKQVAHTELPVQTHVGNWQVIAHFEQLRVPTPGTYRFQVVLEGQILGERKLEVKAGPPKTATPAVA